MAPSATVLIEAPVALRGLRREGKLSSNPLPLAQPERPGDSESGSKGAKEGAGAGRTHSRCLSMRRTARPRREGY